MGGGFLLVVAVRWGSLFRTSTHVLRMLLSAFSLFCLRRPMNALDRTTIIQQATLMEQRGLRVLACACSKTASDLSPLIANVETGMYVTLFTLSSIDLVTTLDHVGELALIKQNICTLSNTMVVLDLIFDLIFVLLCCSGTKV